MAVIKLSHKSSEQFSWNTKIIRIFPHFFCPLIPVAHFSCNLLCEGRGRCWILKEVLLRVVSVSALPLYKELLTPYPLLHSQHWGTCLKGQVCKYMIVTRQSCMDGLKALVHITDYWDYSSTISTKQRMYIFCFKRKKASNIPTLQTWGVRITLWQKMSLWQLFCVGVKGGGNF
jgi:hypothetical protein